MPIGVQFVHDGAGVVLDGTGPLTGHDFIQANRTLLAIPERLHRLCFGLVDLTAVEEVRISVVERRRIAAQDSRLAVEMPRGAAIVVAASRQEMFELARLWQLASHRTGWTTMRVRTRDEARSWIAMEVRQRFDIELSGLELRRDI